MLGSTPSHPRKTYPFALLISKSGFYTISTDQSELYTIPALQRITIVWEQYRNSVCDKRVRDSDNQRFNVRDRGGLALESGEYPN